MGVNNSKAFKSNVAKIDNTIDIKLFTAPPLPLETQTLFDGVRGPFSFKTGTISEEVLEHLTQDGFLLQSPEDLLSTDGFEQADDFPLGTRGAAPGYPKRYKVEGYFHSLPAKESVPSMLPRHGLLHDKPAAPRPIRAFIRALVKENKEMMEEITNIFQPNTTLRRLFEEGKMLSDLVIQISHGDAAGPPFIGYHLDNVNSVLHLSLSIAGGNRTLHVGYADQNLHKTQFTAVQTKGSVYLSAPWVFNHAVEFPDQSWDERVVAIQCRTLYTPEENAAIMREFEEGKYEGDFKDLARAMSDILEKNTLVIPTIQQVKEVENQLP